MTEKDVRALRAIEDEQERLEYFHENVDADFFSNHREYLAETDKAWDAMHRVLADGELTWEGGEYPLNHVVLGGELLYTESDYIMSLKSPKQVREIAAALPTVTEAEFRQRYNSIDADDYGFPKSDDDYGYTWDWFQEVRALYIRAASEGRFVLFTVDQ